MSGHHPYLLSHHAEKLENVFIENFRRGKSIIFFTAFHFFKKEKSEKREKKTVSFVEIKTQRSMIKNLFLTMINTQSFETTERFCFLHTNTGFLVGFDEMKEHKRAKGSTRKQFFCHAATPKNNLKHSKVGIRNGSMMSNCSKMRSSSMR